MRFRPLSPAAALAAALVIVAPVAASAGPADTVAHAAAKKRCALKGSKTVQKNRLARVFRKDSPRAGESERLYGCLYGKNRRILLFTSEFDDGDASGFTTSTYFDLVTLNGRFVAWKTESSEIDDSCRADCPDSAGSSATSVEVVNLRTRRQKSYSVDARALVVTNEGRIAWIDDTGVQAVDSAGRRTLHTGSAAALRVSGTRVRWQDATGQEMTEVLR